MRQITIDKELLGFLPEGLRARVEAGELEALPGQRDDKPVVREVATGRLVPGSGRYPKAIDTARLGKLTAYKHSRSYREKLEELFPLDGNENTPGSLAWLAKMVRLAAEGSPQRVTCSECGAMSIHAFKKDGLLLFKITELLTGKARETQDLNIRSESLIAVLNTRENIKDITVHTIDPGIARDRRLLIEASE